ncbi:AlkP-core domain protein [Halobacterium hubeiense]|uniref:AlkP-core domain protein n=1 Tax=Halobacterium hubeiense TaxID=1407499 RepID=A0A0U5HQV2_9EURY|nr:sulfatase [Halobacterium hubeiense]CQH45834.1 AlkP-core domain protein [Halobacterium hubeiense]
MSDWEHIILLSADALRADHLSCYGYHRNTSPEIDELAADSIQFSNAYSASSHTREAVPSLLTGRYPENAVDENYHLAAKPISSIASQAGFETAGFHSNPFLSRSYGFGRGFDEFDDDLHLGQHKLVALAQRAIDKLRNRHYARADEINKRALNWIDSLNEGESFFLWNHYMDTHGPYEPPGEYGTVFREERVSDSEAQALYQRAIDDPQSITEGERQLLVDYYDGEIRYNDEKIGSFLDALAERGLLEDSLVIFTADHGDAFGERGYYEHPRFLHEELTHVPLLVRSPGGTTGEVTTPVSTLDITATIEAEISPKEWSTGKSLLTISEGDRAVFSQAQGENDESHLRRYGVQTKQNTCFCEYNRETGDIDFGECTDRSLRDELRTHIDEDRGHGEDEDGIESEDVDPEIERRLDALGYKD